MEGGGCWGRLGTFAASLTGFSFPEYLCHVYVRSDGLAGVVIADNEYPQRVCFTLLDKVRVCARSCFRGLLQSPCPGTRRAFGQSELATSVWASFWSSFAKTVHSCLCPQLIQKGWRRRITKVVRGQEHHSWNCGVVLVGKALQDRVQPFPQRGQGHL